MKRLLLGMLKKTLKAISYGVVGGGVVLVGVFVLYLNSRPDLKVWHKAKLDAEFTADAPARNFEDYLAIEARLFRQLGERVYARVEAEEVRTISRFHRGSASDPGLWETDWNRTFQLSAAPSGAGVLLLHGMSDSPYSLRHLGQRLNAAGAWVIGLRLPGHGTAPAGLVRMHWKDAAAAVRLAVRRLRDKVGEKPIYIIGYSNGGALAVHYALAALEDNALPQVTGLVLISPAIGVSKLAVLAIWQARLGHLLGLSKLEWNSLLPEYDPFKYQSFAVNAGDQVYRLTDEIQTLFDRLGASGGLTRFPPVLAFQSAVDATVSTRALATGLFLKLAKGDHELVLFDINRGAEVSELISKDPIAEIEFFFKQSDLPFAIGLVTNLNEESRDVILRRKMPDETKISEMPLGLKWPRELYSLSHVALPFPETDPLYGAHDLGDRVQIQLGSLELRGERGVLQIPASDMLRLKWNPFYAYIEQRLLEFVRLSVP